MTKISNRGQQTKESFCCPTVSKIFIAWPNFVQSSIILLQILVEIWTKYVDPNGGKVLTAWIGPFCGTFKRNSLGYSIILYIIQCQFRVRTTRYRLYCIWDCQTVRNEFFYLQAKAKLCVEWLGIKYLKWKHCPVILADSTNTISNIYNIIFSRLGF